MTAATIPAALSAVKTSFDLIKNLRELLKKPKVNPSEVLASVLDLQALLIEAQKGLADAEDDNRVLRKRITELEQSADFGKDFAFQEGVYWHREYPYCPNCWDADRKPIRLNGPYASTSGKVSSWKCPVHDSRYYLKRRTAHE